MICYDTIINGLKVEATYSDAFINDIAVPLLVNLTKMRREKGSRIIVFLAAPPGAGKSTLTDFLVKLSQTTDDVDPITGIGMDGFHHYQDYLLTHYAFRDGKKMSMVDIKGAPITFDIDALRERIERVASGEKVPWPIYDRLLHNPVDGKIIVDGEIVLIEGNYLLLDEDGWRDLSKYADYTISIDADPMFLRERLIKRKMASGADEKKAIEFVDFSDMANVNICQEKMMEADLKLKLDLFF